ncbi:MAG TPA: polysaccharide pyruvyl transferase family protein, partial [Chroococcidiopsis sp.]
MRTLTTAVRRRLIARELVESGILPVTWVSASVEIPFANLGDALSPILLSALTGLTIEHRAFDSHDIRMASVGSIGHNLRNGSVHLWGTGFEPGWQRPAATTFWVHGLRGPVSAQTLRSVGIDAPAVYGDPVWFLPSIFSPPVEKKYELGVIVHLAELAEKADGAAVKPHFVRYNLPDELQSSIRLINTITPPTLEGIESRVNEILSCKRIASTSLHGLVIAETYGIPCTYFRTLGQGAAVAAIDDETEPLNWRMRDFYAGIGNKTIFTYGQQRHIETDWLDLIDAIDRGWSPL